MKKIVQVVLVGGLFVLFAGFSAIDKKWEKPFSRLDNEVRKNSKAYQTLGEATKTIGHRLTGSVNGEKAEEYAFQLLKSYGFTDVSYQPFEVEAWMRDTVTLSIAPSSSDNFREVPVVSLAHSPVESKLQGEIVDVGNGLEEDFEAIKERIKGKVALANINLVGAAGKKNLHRSEKTALAIKYGATGVIMVNGAPGKILLTGTASVTGAIISIPAVCISNDSGGELRKWLKEEGPLEAHIDMHNISKPIKARNVIATLRGKSDERVIIGGHLDSWDLATGAIDNGIGSFAVMDIARAFKALKVKPERTIQFVLFMGEEQGLLGSKHFVSELKKSGEINKVSYMMNLDMTNDPRGVNAFGRDEMNEFFASVGSAIQHVDQSFKNESSNRAGLHSDHQPFMLEGVPIAGLSGHLDPNVLQCYHADCDDFSLVNKDQFENTVRIASMYLYALANTETIAVSKLSDAKTRDYLISQGLKEELVIGQEWRWEQ
ncbi:M20/M25/M40 family metallo-hydrolase [Dyadobacter chenwenxiniae]|uniref:Carboxypeptidase Q n=1 Tax=Dyadobacter chenwenxiniae TaxID=2906456 RepID=A0A9X1PJK3_9BACT|nr:M28 family peptidase [Dyadobacter chenwenxiniae]MCF0061921.1 M20/M25/M40 family metallo-hydrolase [Dyadobacter chenwenxiniae]UON81735.1 M20/M25/M40 family metallo-hydrolase [Dyadobacter chenwenxiniae]